MLKHRISFRYLIGASLLVAFIGMFTASAIAADFAQKIEFSAAQLDPLVWQILAGEPGALRVENKQLTLTAPTGGTVRLLCRAYPLHSENRPAFGDFRASVQLAQTSGKGLIRFGLRQDTRWRLQIELDLEKSAVRLVCTERAPNAIGENVAAGEWQSLADFAGKSGSMEFVRIGKIVEGRYSANGKTIAAGRWNGNLPPLLDFTFSLNAPTTSTEPAFFSTTGLTVSPLPKRAIDLALLRRTGKPLSGDNLLPEKTRNNGGEYEGGYLWPHGEQAQMKLRLCNILGTPTVVVLKTSVTDWLEKELSATSLRYDLAAYEERMLTIPVYAEKCGFFTFRVQAQDPDGAPLLAPLSAGYGVSAAPNPKNLATDNPVGTHASPFARQGAKWVRYWDNGGGMFWASIEKEKGKWDWSGLDAYVQRTLAAGMRPLIVLAAVPEWASTNTSYGNYLGRGSFSPPKDIADWAEYCRRVADRYKGKVTHYEIWNEPNGNELGPKGFFFYGSAEQYFALMKAGYQAVKQADPHAQVLAPSGTGHFFPFLERILQLGGGQFFDILSIHTYCTPLPPEIGYHFNGEKDYPYRVRHSREIMARFGVNKPIWNTEIGYHWGLESSIGGRPMDQDLIAAEAKPGYWPNWTPNWSFRPLDPRRAACFFPRFLLLTPANNVEKCFIHHRLMHHDNGSPYIPAPAVAWTSVFLDGAKYDTAYDWGKGIQAHGFALSGGRYGVAVWRVEEESLYMSIRDARKIGKIDSAPLAGAEQKALEPVAGPAPRTSYFPAGRMVPQWLTLSSQPQKAHDLWGNELNATVGAPGWRISEAPLYLIFSLKPQELTATVTTARVEQEDFALAPFAPAQGKLIPAGEPLSWAADIKTYYPQAVQLPVVTGKSEGKADVYPGTVNIHDLGLVRYKVPEGSAPVKRLLIKVRSSDRLSGNYNYRYAVLVQEKEQELNPWTVLPVLEAERGQGYAVMQGWVLSPELNLKPGEEFVLKGFRGHGRLYEIWLIP